MFRPFVIWPSSGWIQLSEKLYTYTDTNDCIVLYCYIVSLINLSNLKMAKSEMAETCN